MESDDSPSPVDPALAWLLRSVRDRRSGPLIFVGAGLLCLALIGVGKVPPVVPLVPVMVGICGLGRRRTAIAALMRLFARFCAALPWPRPRAAAAGVALGIAALLAASYVGDWFVDLLDQPSVDPDREARAAGVAGESGLVAQLGYLGWLCVLAPATEELWVRGFMRGLLVRGLNSYLPRLLSIMVTVVTCTVAFGFMHTYSLTAQLAVAVSGLFYGLAREVTGSVWPAIAAHMTYNVGVTLEILGAITLPS